MISEEIINKFKIRYSDLHPLIFHRSVERAMNELELFDILESAYCKPPLKWDDDSRLWISCDKFGRLV